MEHFFSGFQAGVLCIIIYMSKALALGPGPSCMASLLLIVEILQFSFFSKLLIFYNFSRKDQFLHLLLLELLSQNDAYELSFSKTKEVKSYQQIRTREIRKLVDKIKPMLRMGKVEKAVAKEYIT